MITGLRLRRARLPIAFARSQAVERLADTGSMTIDEEIAIMKKKIHPKYELTTIRCACGAEYRVRSTRPDQRLEICAGCHPYFTGKQKLVDTAGRVEKFKRRYAKFAQTPSE